MSDTTVSPQRHRMGGHDRTGHKAVVVKTGAIEHHVTYNNLNDHHTYDVFSPHTQSLTQHHSLGDAVHQLRKNGHVDLSDHHIKLHHLHEEEEMDNDAIIEQVVASLVEQAEADGVELTEEQLVEMAEQVLADLEERKMDDGEEHERREREKQRDTSRSKQRTEKQKSRIAEATGAMLAAAHAGTPVEFAAAFADAMQARVLDRIDSLRPEVGAGMFGSKE